MKDGLAAPCPFLEHPGAPVLPWRMWFRLFCNYLDAAFATVPADKRKRAILLNCLGTEGQRIFYTLPSKGDTFDPAVCTLEEFLFRRSTFVPKGIVFDAVGSCCPNVLIDLLLNYVSELLSVNLDL
ncbi:hypothetical protein M513_10906 [Trichuris suis]|uniref:Uncharacterized protein n=1 Tax=Trichuris suis TaxID=68888 RepID=A0A085LT96_9BILA|nr:hypothetical protein M513_10906 [Trichuris suis]